MDPVTVAVVTAVISAAGTVLAAWVQARAQRPANVRPAGFRPRRAGVGGRNKHSDRSRAPT